MSENKPNWAEKANVALNTIQVAQNDQLQRTLGALGALQAEQARLELNEQQTQERESQLRELVWKLENSLNELLSNQDLSSSGIYVLVTQIRGQLDLCGVSTAGFRQFEDKDRLGQFINRLEQARNDSRSQLSGQQRSDLETFLSFQSEAQELDELVEDLQGEKDHVKRLFSEAVQSQEAATRSLEYWRTVAKDQRQRKKFAGRRWQRRLSKTGLLILAAPTILAWVVALCFLAIPVFTLVSDGFTSIEWDIAGYGTASLLIAIGCTMSCLRLEKKTKPEPSIEERIVLAEGELKLAEAQISARQHWVAAPLEPEIFAKFQANDLPGLLQRKEERNAFMLKFRQSSGLPKSDFYQQSSIVVLNLSTGRRVTLSPEVQRLARHGEKKMAAIKLYREQTGAGIAEAKEAVEAFICSENRQQGTI